MTTTDNFDTVCLWDPAIDVEASDDGFVQFIQTRDLSLLKWLQGAKPERFTLRPIDNDWAIKHLLSEPNVAERRSLAFQMSVVRVHNHQSAVDFSTVDAWSPPLLAELKKGQQKVTPFILSERDLKRFDVPTIQEIGEVALTRAFLLRATKPKFVLPPTSQHLLTVTPGLYAALLRSMRKKKTGLTGQQQQDQQEDQQDDDESGPPGDADAPVEPGNVLERSVALSIATGERSSGQ